MRLHGICGAACATAFDLVQPGAAKNIGIAFAAARVVTARDEPLKALMGVTRLADLPAEWSRQHQMLGLQRSPSSGRGAMSSGTKRTSLGASWVCPPGSIF